MTDDEAMHGLRVISGRAGAKQRAQSLSAAQRKAIALRAAAARWKDISPAERSRMLREAALARWGWRDS
jgi:hypothetical protein